MDRAPGQAASTATEALDVAFELNKLLDCGLDRETLSVCIALIESGVNPEVGDRPDCSVMSCSGVASLAAAFA